MKQPLLTMFVHIQIYMYIYIYHFLNDLECILSNSVCLELPASGLKKDRDVVVKQVKDVSNSINAAIGKIKVNIITKFPLGLRTLWIMNNDWIIVSFLV